MSVKKRAVMMQSTNKQTNKNRAIRFSVGGFTNFHYYYLISFALIITVALQQVGMSEDCVILRCFLFWFVL